MSIRRAADTSGDADGTARNGGVDVDRMQRLARSRAAAEPAPQLQLWPEALRVAPTAILRSALFSAISPTSRRTIRDEVVASTAGVTIRYTGDELSQSDFDVWSQAVHLSRGLPLGEPVEFAVKEFLKGLGLSYGKSQRDWLRSVLIRLMATSVEIRVDHLGRSFAGSLIVDYERDDFSGRYRLGIDRRLHGFFGPDAHTRLRVDRRIELRRKTLASWLFNFLSTHGSVHDIRVSTYRRLSGSRTRDIHRFRAALREALDVLATMGFVESWSIDRSSDLVSIRRR